MLQLEGIFFVEMYPLRRIDMRYNSFYYPLPTEANNLRIIKIMDVIDAASSHRI
jgi:hypothetical protein